MSGPTRAALLRAAAERLAAAGVPDPVRDVRLLLRWASGLDAAELSATLAEPPAAAERAAFGDAVARRSRREPVSHITGQRLFWGRAFRVTSAVLDPRPETETLVAAALEAGPFARIADLGTGSGCLLATLLAEWPEATGIGVDCSAEALDIAAANLRAIGVAARAELRPGNWLDGIAERFDLIVSNPPYLAEAEIAALAPEVREHEPRVALTPGGDGLDAYRAIARAAPDHLTGDGCLMLEIGPDQAARVRALLTAAGFGSIAVLVDMDGRDRTIISRR